MESKEKKNGAQSVEGAELDGEVRINHSVIANIIRISVLEVEGVAGVGGGFIDGMAELFSRKNTERGVTVREDEGGRYSIEVRVSLYFGSPMTEVAANIQRNVARQVAFMTQKSVARVNVIIDGVKARDGTKGKTAEGGGLG
ncbi:MAG: Asp23/Gls24 family envelope stress response protein [Puniceicoccales bacterium]|jgi:uncharacterized alkaline shock family protein YloU|nr:Asp23/Gls24 family envelope stress response protein [Puniceicoccales bacterium]